MLSLWIARINLAAALMLLAVSLLIYLPAPTYQLWVLAALISEIPLPLALLGLTVLGISQFLFSFGRHRLLATSSTVVAALAVSLALTTVQNIYLFAGKAGLKLDAIAAFSLNRSSGNGNCQRGIEYTKLDGKPILMDVYRPDHTRAAGAAIIVVHGGSWKGGKRSDFDACDYWLADQGYTVYDIDYRLADASVHYPAQVDDLVAAVAFIKGHYKDWGSDPDRLALLGRSAGAQVVLDATYRADLSGKALSKCVIGFYPPTDLAWDWANPIQPDVINAKSVLENYLGGTPNQKAELYQNASPALNVCPATQPTLLLHGLHDQLVAPENTFKAQAALQKQHCVVDTCILPWANHGFDWNFNGFSSQISRSAMLRFLHKNL